MVTKRTVPPTQGCCAQCATGWWSGTKVTCVPRWRRSCMRRECKWCSRFTCTWSRQQGHKRRVSQRQGVVDHLSGELRAP
jgi:hypothetical protein